jgi:hypothetical protein
MAQRCNLLDSETFILLWGVRCKASEDHHREVVAPMAHIESSIAFVATTGICFPIRRPRGVTDTCEYLCSDEYIPGQEEGEVEV